MMLSNPSLVFPNTSDMDEDRKPTVGWIEKIQILPENILVHAKIDTGADTSSLNVSELSEFDREGKHWVSFTVTTQESQRIRLEKQVVRYVKIKRKGAESLRRPVVTFDLCLGSILHTHSQVNLADRKNFKYNMLIGRSFLKGRALVDSSLTYSQNPECGEE